MSYNKILSVVNEHTVSTVIARYAISMAASCKAALVLYGAHDAGSNETVLRHLDRHLEQLVTDASALGIPVTQIIEIGNINALLPKRVEAEKADLVFFPFMPFKRYGADLARHMVHQLQRTITSDLAIMRVIAMVKPHPARILVPLGRCDGNMERRQVFVTELANCFHAQVTLFHLANERGMMVMPDGAIHFREHLQQQEVSVLERLGTGHIGDAIAVEAVTRHNDLIVMGASEHGVLRKLLFGNPSGEVMRHPPCNTIIFRHATDKL